ncbi:MAG: prepilin-type N-terminal cleavage/methylation domain-containing protein [Acidobacteria bacterium]|nr:prepilin-type N-terminal cleavage/methylation domain-containing protein [Acidobacteriota bacterium]
MTYFRSSKRPNPVSGDKGFSMIELLTVVLIIGLIAVMALPGALTGVKAYRLHSNATALSTQLGMARLRATSQNTPYRVQIAMAAAPHQFSLDRLCGTTPVSVDSNCSAPYQARTGGTEFGPQPVDLGVSFITTNPGGTSSYPGTITGGTASTVFYFNTRGMPVDSTGNPLTNGGVVIYLTNGLNLTDAVVVSVGGRVSTYQWMPSTSTWTLR